MVALFATSAAGGVFVPINPLLRPQQVGYILGDCGARVLVTSAERLALLDERAARDRSVEHVIVVGDAADPRTTRDARCTAGTALRAGEDRARARA